MLRPLLCTQAAVAEMEADEREIANDPERLAEIAGAPSDAFTLADDGSIEHGGAGVARLLGMRYVAASGPYYHAFQEGGLEMQRFSNGRRMLSCAPYFLGYISVWCRNW